MQKYDKIYVPDEKGEFKVQQFYEDYNEWTDIHDGYGDVSEKENVIVLNVEELREVWKAAQEYQRQGPNYLTFSKYLQSKGVEI